MGADKKSRIENVGNDLVESVWCTTWTSACQKCQSPHLGLQGCLSPPLHIGPAPWAAKIRGGEQEVPAPSPPPGDTHV